MSRMGQSSLIGSAEASRRLGLSRSHFNRKVNAGDIPHALKMPGATGVFMFAVETIEEIAKESTK